MLELPDEDKEPKFLIKMSPSDNIIYDYPTVYDEYKDEEWYLWFGSDDCQCDEKIDEEDYVPIRNIPKNPFMFVQVCAVLRKQAARIRSPLDLSAFWICDSRLIDARSNRWDFQLEFSARSYVFPKLLFVQVCAVSGKQAAQIRSPLDRSDFWICDPRLIDARSDHRDFRLEFSSRNYNFLKLLQFVNFRNMLDKDGMYHDEDHYLWVQQAINGGTDRADEKEKARNELENSSVSSNTCVEILEEGHSIVREKHSNYSFDPGGCNSDSTCQAKGKLENEFFQEGENDAVAFGLRLG